LKVHHFQQSTEFGYGHIVLGALAEQHINTR